MPAKDGGRGGSGGRHGPPKNNLEGGDRASPKTLAKWVLAGATIVRLSTPGRRIPPGKTSLLNRSSLASMLEKRDGATRLAEIEHKPPAD